jgi:hypothetical protein
MGDAQDYKLNEIEGENKKIDFYKDLSQVSRNIIIT